MQILQSLMGTSPAVRSAENPANSILDEWTQGNRTNTGISMTPGRALEYAPVWQAVSMISGDIAGLPLEVMKRDVDDGRAADKGHPAYRLLARKANQEMTAFIFWRTILTHLCIWNRAYAWVIRDQNATPLELIPLLPDRTEAKRGEYHTEVDDQMRSIKATNVLHFHGISTDTTEGCELVTKARNSWSMGLAAEKFGSKFFKNGMRVSGVLQHPGRLRETGRENLENSFNKKYAGLDNVAKVIVLEENAKFIKTTISPDEAQFTGTREEQVRDVARWYNVDPSLLGVAGSVSYNSKEEANRAYWQSGLMPWSNTIRWECWDKLLTEQEKETDSHIIEHNTMALLAGDIKTQAEVEEIWHRLGTRTANQIARSHNLAPVGDSGDQYYITSNVQPADLPPDASDAPVTDEPARNDILATSQVVLAESLQRAINRIGMRARRLSKNPAKFVEWLDSGIHDDVLVSIVSVQARAYSTLTGQRAEADRLIAEMILDVQRSLNLVIDSVSGEELPEAVDTEMSKLEGNLPKQLSEGIAA